jgi:TetR/AcrR family transcriptional repressor of nem operon
MPTTGRPREFDEDVVLGRVMDVFWQRGYAQTSIQNVVAAADVQRGSLYGAFGNKQSLLLLALDRYRAAAEANLARIAAMDPVLPALREFLAASLATQTTSPGRGCLLGNTAVEVAWDDADVNDAVRAGFATLEHGLRQILAAAETNGEIPPADSELRVGLIMAVQQGLHVIARTDPSPQRLSGAVDATMHLISCGV